MQVENEIIRKYDLKAAGCVDLNNSKIMNEGWDNILFELADQTIVRFPRSKSNAFRLERELRLLATIQSHISLPLPLYEVFCYREGNIVCAGYKKLPGETINSRPKPLYCKNSDSSHNGQAVEALILQAAKFLRQLHQIPAEILTPTGMPTVYGADKRNQIYTLFRRLRKRLYPVIGKKVSDLLELNFRDFLGDRNNFSFNPVPVHNDLLMNNVLWNPISGQITGILDWGDSSLSDPAVDFAGFMYEFGNDFSRKLLRDYGSRGDAGILERAEFYARIVPIYSLLRELNILGKIKEETLNELISRLNTPPSKIQ